MTGIERQQSLAEIEEHTIEGQREMAAADAEIRISHLLQKAARVSGVSQRELAERLEVSEGRVSQVLNAEGNLRISTVARYLRAMGYRLEIDAEAAEEGVPSLKTLRRPRRAANSFHAFGILSHGPNSQNAVVLTDQSNLHSFHAEDVAYLGQIAIGQYHFTSRGQTLAASEADTHLSGRNNANGALNR